MGALIVTKAAPQMTVQDLGRPGYLSVGLSRGGAADRLAHAEGAALLDQAFDTASLEIAGGGAELRVEGDTQIALTGAPMRASIDGEAVPWNASHPLPAGSVVALGAARVGSYSYLSVTGGFQTQAFMGSRAAHLAARIGARIVIGDRLQFAENVRLRDAGQCIDADNRFDGGVVRVVPGAQTMLFPESALARFAKARFRRSPLGNRQGVRFDFDGKPFRATGQRTVLSEMIVPGDIQMTGEGMPFVLLPECQTTGGYPRIGSVLPEDLPRVAQAAPGTEVLFEFMSLDAARAASVSESVRFQSLRARVKPLTRDPRNIPDLLSYQLVSGMTAGVDQGEDREWPKQSI